MIFFANCLIFYDFNLAVFFLIPQMLSLVKHDRIKGQY